jgi:uncharacterized protein YndB with AHSA1/START domain
MTDDLTFVQVDEFLPHPPSRVWQALTDPVMLGDWLMPNDFQLVVGHRFTFRSEPIEAVGFSGVTTCEVLEVRPEELISYSWADAAKPEATDWRVTWTLRAEGKGTRLFLEHRGFDPDDPTQQLSRTMMGGGWRNHVLRRMAEYLAEAHA